VETSAGEAVYQGRRMAARTPRTMLVVDDAPSIVRGRTRLLRHEGYAVAAASNGCEVLAQRHQRPYEVMLTDLRMPTLDGCAFSARLQLRWPALCPRVLCLPGGSDDADSQAFLAQRGCPW
jgi:CheY-like chemotaxis protein